MTTLKTVVNPFTESDIITYDDIINEEYTLLVYSNDDFIGAVVCVDEKWTISTTMEVDTFPDLKGILMTYKHYTFKAIT